MANKFQLYLGELLDMALPISLSRDVAITSILRHLPPFLDAFSVGEIGVAYEVMQGVFGLDYTQDQRSNQYRRLCEYAIFMTAEQLSNHTESQKVIDFIQGKSPDFVYSYALSKAKYFMYELFCGEDGRR